MLVKTIAGNPTKAVQGSEWVKTDEIGNFLQLGKVSGRFWYEDSGREVLALVGGNIEEAARFIQLLAIYSANTKVDVNTTAAIKAWNMYKRRFRGRLPRCHIRPRYKGKKMSFIVTTNGKAVKREVFT